MSRRGSSLSITTILKKAQRQGASAFTLNELLERLHRIAGQKTVNITDNSHINVKKLLENGIRLHPFLIQIGPITIEQLENLQLESPRARRRIAVGMGHEDLTLPAR